MAKVTPFRVDVPEDDLADLRRRIRETRWAEDFGNEGWTYGVEGGWLRELTRYWSDGFDWRAQEAAINSYPQYRVEIYGVPVHFLHVRGKGHNPMPILLTHGWPWTFWDWRGVIGPLTDPVAHGGDAQDAFDVVIPSLPGYGFSTPLRRTGVERTAFAELFAQLMTQVLGYRRFAAAGGDVGAGVTTQMAYARPELVIGAHLLTPLFPGVSPFNVPLSDYAPEEAWMRDRMAQARPTTESHVAVQSNDPQTLAYALNDSPVGLAAWLWERRRAWSDCDGDVIGRFGADFLCAQASIYWHTGTIGTSMRYYKERALKLSQAPPSEAIQRVAVPTAMGVFPRDVMILPRKYVEARTDLRRWTVFPRGGHYGPAEEPELVAADYRAFFSGLRESAY